MSEDKKKGINRYAPLSKGAILGYKFKAINLSCVTCNILNVIE